jgi:hypothetical protein
VGYHLGHTPIHRLVLREFEEPGSIHVATVLFHVFFQKIKEPEREVPVFFRFFDEEHPFF